jgi:uncharacterized damage-inducible protein DinB
LLLREKGPVELSPKKGTSFSLHEALRHAHATNNRINAYLIENLPDEAWRASPPDGKGRDIASIAAHIHNVRVMWLKAMGATTLPAKLDGESVTKQGVLKALEASSQALESHLMAAMEGDGRIKGFKPDVGSFLAYLIAHDAHHRGQITMLARQTGHAVSQGTMFGLWEWGTR